MIPGRHNLSSVGLLGGSFNPAHDGHREISLEALRALNLDSVWWLVTPGNPLKSDAEYADYGERLAEARAVANHPRIVVSNFEERKGLRYTVDTLTLLRDLWPQMKFVWLMGADSLASFHLWRDWRTIARLAPIAVFNRPGSEAAREDSIAAAELREFEVEESRANVFASLDPPAWTFIAGVANPSSSTAIRMRRGRGLEPQA